tara:strand:- start:2495 stop:3178 length:684 start_codon:yes stop_codon:yes gene_type:complete
MFVDNSFFNDENARRLSFGVLGATLTHALILAWISLPVSQKIISAEMFSPPTNVSIRFITPIKELPEPLPEIIKVEPVQKKPVIQKIAKAIPQEPLPKILNRIEPAAAPPAIHQPERQPVQEKRIEISKPVRDIIPVISASSIKGRRVQPQYPKRSLRMRQEGIVWLHVLISKDGKRQDIKLHKPSQYALLNQAALKAVKKWTFNPNIVNGRAVQSWVEIPIEFKIQ